MIAYSTSVPTVATSHSSSTTSGTPAGERTTCAGFVSLFRRAARRTRFVDPPHRAPGSFRQWAMPRNGYIRSGRGLRSRVKSGDASKSIAMVPGFDREIVKLVRPVADTGIAAPLVPRCSKGW